MITFRLRVFAVSSVDVQLILFHDIRASGVPTPDPIYLLDQGSPTTLKWNFGPGVPTPDPIYLKDKGSPTTLKWNFSPGSESFSFVLEFRMIMC